MNLEISPRPWIVRVEGGSVKIVDARGGVVALMKHAGGRKLDNARALAVAVNNYDEA